MTTTPDEALAIFRAAALETGELYELLGRLTVLVPDALVQAVLHTQKDRT